MSASSIIILLSIVALIVIGYKTKLNYGLIGIAFAFIFGCFAAGMSANTVVNQWPARLFFQMFTISLFYAFSINNGTLELLSRKFVGLAKNFSPLIPFMLFIIGGVMAGIGPGSIAMFLVFTPIIMQIGKDAGMNPVLSATTMTCGINCGAWSPIAVNGITTYNLIEAAGYTAEEAASYSATVWGSMAIITTLVFLGTYFILGGYKRKKTTFEETPAFNKEQKTNFILIIIMTALLLIPAMIDNLFTGGALSWFVDRMDATLLAVVFSILAIFLKVGNEKKAFASVPWSTIVMVCGVAMLVGVAAEAGALEYVAGYIGNNIGLKILPYIMVIVCGIFSMFSSTMGVVVPTMYPLIAAIAVASGGSPAFLFAVVPFSAGHSGITPFSLTGGLVMATVEEENKHKMFIVLTLTAICRLAAVLVFVAILMLLGVFRI